MNKEIVINCLEISKKYINNQFGKKADKIIDKFSNNFEGSENIIDFFESGNVDNINLAFILAESTQINLDKILNRFYETSDVYRDMLNIMKKSSSVVMDTVDSSDYNTNADKNALFDLFFSEKVWIDELDFSNDELTKIPKILITKLRVFNLQHTDIPIKWNFSNNKITDIPNNLKIDELDLSNNKITDIYSVEGLQVRAIDLTGNKIQIITESLKDCQFIFLDKVLSVDKKLKDKNDIKCVFVKGNDYPPYNYSIGLQFIGINRALELINIAKYKANEVNTLDEKIAYQRKQLRFEKSGLRDGYEILGIFLMRVMTKMTNKKNTILMEFNGGYKYLVNYKNEVKIIASSRVFNEGIVIELEPEIYNNKKNKVLLIETKDILPNLSN